MIKRIISLVLVCILAIPILVVPASATSDHVTDTQFDMFVTSLGNILNIINNNISAVNNNIVTKLDGIEFQVSEIHRKLISWFETYLIPILTEQIWTKLDGIEFQVSEIHRKLISWFETYLIPILTEQIWTKLDGIEFQVLEIHRKLITWFDEKLLPKLQILIDGESGAADDFNDQVSTEATEFVENLDIIQDVTRPTIEDIDLDIDKEIPEGEVVKVGQLLGIFFQNQYIYIIFFISFTFALVSYGIFGKR